MWQTTNGGAKTHAGWHTYRKIPDDEEGPLSACQDLECNDSPVHSLFPGKRMKDYYYYDLTGDKNNIVSLMDISPPDFNTYDTPQPQKPNILQQRASIIPSEPENALEYPQQAVMNPRESFKYTEPLPKENKTPYIVGAVAISLLLIAAVTIKD